MHRAVDATDLSIIWPTPSPPLSFVQIRNELARSKNNIPTPASSPAPPQDEKNKKAEIEGQKITKFFDPEIGNNAAQTRAVEAVLFRQNDHVPFLLFGSFGTGKTKTLVCSHNKNTIPKQHTATINVHYI
jgi:hypothetical protein